MSAVRKNTINNTIKIQLTLGQCTNLILFDVALWLPLGAKGLKRLQKDRYSGDAWMCWVSQTQWRRMVVFQARGAATKNARPPFVVRHDDGVTRADADADRSLFLGSMSAKRRSSLARYGGAVLCRHRKTWTEFKLYPLWHPQPVKVTE